MEMLPVLRRLRKRWKRYVFGSVAFTLLGSYLASKLRDKNVIREYCQEAKRYGESRVTSGVLGLQRKVVVFLNPRANKQEAKIQFTKYCAPLLHLAGLDVTVVESDYQGQIRTLMGYIDPQTDVIVVAGGDGTLMEVVNGLMRRYDAHKAHTIPIGVLPLGKENRFYKSSPLGSGYHKSPARRLGEATMNIVSGTAVPVNLMTLQPENGRTLYALSGVEWGALNDATENRDSFRLFGKLRLIMSHLSTALRRWPTDHKVHVWMPNNGWRTESTSGGQPPGVPIFNKEESRNGNDKSNDGGATAHVTKASNPILKKGISPLMHTTYASCAQQEQQQGDNSEAAAGTGEELTSLVSSVQGHPHWSHHTFCVIGFSLSLLKNATLPDNHQPLSLSLWPSTISKGSFINHGWSKTVNSPFQLPGNSFRSSEIILQPVGKSWLSIDGEEFEPMPLAIRVLPNHLYMLSRTK